MKETFETQTKTFKQKSLCQIYIFLNHFPRWYQRWNLSSGVQTLHRKCLFSYCYACSDHNLVLTWPDQDGEGSGEVTVSAVLWSSASLFFFQRRRERLATETSGFVLQDLGVSKKSILRWGRIVWIRFPERDPIKNPWSPWTYAWCRAWCDVDTDGIQRYFCEMLLPRGKVFG